MITALQKVKAILDTIPSTDLPVKFQYLESQPTSFPAGCVLSLGFTENILDTSHNLVMESFVIRLIFPQEESLTGYEKWMTLLDLVSAEFRKASHQTLDGAAVSFMIRQGPPPEASDQYSQAVMIFDIIVDAKIIKLITN